MAGTVAFASAAAALSGKFHRQVAYGLTLPVDVTISDLPENESAGFTLEVQPDSTCLLYTSRCV